jgi:hypothetical protein
VRDVLERCTGKREASCHDALPDAAGTHELLHLHGPLRTALPGLVLDELLLGYIRAHLLQDALGTFTFIFITQCLRPIGQRISAESSAARQPPNHPFLKFRDDGPASEDPAALCVRSPAGLKPWRIAKIIIMIRHKVFEPACYTTYALPCGPGKRFLSPLYFGSTTLPSTLLALMLTFIYFFFFPG